MSTINCKADSTAQLRNQVSGTSDCSHIVLSAPAYDLSDGQLTVAKNVTIIGRGAVLDAKANEEEPRHVLDLSRGVTAKLDGVVITGGYVTGEDDGAGIHAFYVTLDMIRCNLTSNRAVRGKPSG